MAKRFVATVKAEIILREGQCEINSSQEGATLSESGYSLTVFKQATGQSYFLKCQIHVRKNLNNCFYNYNIDYADRNKQRREECCISH